MAKKVTSAVADVANVVKSPISFKEFSKDPVKGLLFIVILAIGALYIDGKVNYINQIKTQGTKNENIYRLY